MGGMVSVPRSKQPIAPWQGSPEIRKLSVVIPAVNEGSHIESTLNSVQKDSNDLNEVIVVDGGSTDNTVSIAASKHTKVVKSRRGRGLQLNVGWKASLGDWVLFLHADTQLPKGYQGLMQHAISKPQRTPPCWGYFFSIDTDLDGITAWILRNGVALRSHVLKQPYGDQGIFVSRKALEVTGGFKDWPLLEDVEMVGRLKKLSPPAVVPVTLKTSGRRWRRLGFIKTTAINQFILVCYQLGVHPETLARWYYRMKE